MIPSLSKLLTAACAVIILAVYLPSPGAALEVGRYSESEKVGFAFGKLANSVPDFESWIVGTEKYQEALPADKIEMLKKERARLENGFFNYFPDGDLVSVEIDALIRASNYFAQSQKTGELTDITIEMTDLPENYFPFQIGGIWIALVIKDYDLFTRRIMTAEEYRDFAKTLGLAGPYQLAQKVGIDFKLRPVSVDISAPLMLDGLEMWLMLAEVGEMTVWRQLNRDKQLLWAYNAPWYVSEDHKELLMLYQE